MSTPSKGLGRILIVDDAVDLTSALKPGLESHGFQVDVYNDPTVALSRFKPGIYDEAILDISMPQMTGFELFREMRKIDPSLDVCFFTAFEVYRNEFERMFPELHATAFFRKPISIAALAAQLNELLGGKTRADTPRASPSPPSGSKASSKDAR